MIDINKLRRLTQAALTGPDGASLNWLKLLQDFQKEANPAAISELLDRLEEAESDAIEQARLNGMGSEREAALMAKLEMAEKERAIDEQRIADLMAELNRVGHENEELRANIEAMEKKEPAATVRINAINGNPSVDFVPGHRYLHHNDKLYLAPGAQPVPSVPTVFVWPECPKRRQSHVLFDDGYEEGWAACVATIKAMIAAAPKAKP